MKKVLSAVVASALLFPVVVGAQQINVGEGTLLSIWGQLLGLINSLLIPTLMAIATVYFLWGVVQFIGGADDEEARKKGKDKIIYGLIGLVVMISMWALVGFIQSSFNVGSGRGSTITPPTVPIPNNPTGN